MLKQQNNIAGGAGILMLGTVVSQSIIVLSSPVLTRLYSPEEFGVLAVYVSIFALLTIVISLRYELAVPLSKSISEALAVVKLSLLITFTLVAVLTVLLMLFGKNGVNLLNVRELYDYMWLLPLGVFIAGLHKVLSFWVLRNKDFAFMAIGRVLQGSGMVSAQIVLGVINLGFIGLIAGHIIGFAAALAFFLWASVQSHFFAIRKIRSNLLKKMAYKYQKFPKFSTWSDLLNVFGTQFPPVVIASIFSAEYAGFYLLASRIASAPVALVAEAVGKSFMVASVSHRGKGSLPELTLEVFQLLLKLSLGPMVITAIIAPAAFHWIFGEQWLEAGLYLQFMIPWIIAVFVFVPLMSLYVVLEQQQVEFRFQILLVATRLGGLVAGALLGGIMEAIILYAILAAVSYAICGGWIIHAAGVRMTQLFSVAFKEAFYIIILVLPFYALKVFLVEDTYLIPLSQLIALICISILLISVFVLRAWLTLAKLKHIEQSQGK